MPRAAAELNLQSSEPTVFTTLKKAVARDPCARSGKQHFETVHAVATAFITNLSGGAACYDVDLSLVAQQAVSSALTDAIADMQKKMSCADTAGWRVVGESVADAKAKALQTAVVVVADAENGAGDNVTTESQELTLHIDVTGAPPITAVTISDRIITATCPEWGIVTTPDDVAALTGARGSRRIWRPETATAEEMEGCTLADTGWTW